MEQYGYESADSYIQVPINDKSVVSEISGDFTLPDYQPEIKRLLRVGASVLPASRYIGDREAELAGNIDYYVYYTGSDNEIYCAPLTAEYKLSIPTEATEAEGLANMTGCVSVIPDMISGRVLSPRKLSIKCRLRARARIYGDMSIDDTFDSDSGETQVLQGRVDTMGALCVTGELFRLSDEILIGGQGGDVRVAAADGKALLTEVKCSQGAINCRGELYLKLLMSREDGGMPAVTLRKLPFSQTIAAEGVGADSNSCARATVCEMNITVDEGRVGVDVGLMIEAEASKKAQIGYIKDVYSTSRETSCEYNDVEITRSLNNVNGNFSLNHTVSLEEAGIGLQSIPVDISGAVQVEACSFGDRRCVVTGKVRFAMLLDKDDEYSSSDVEIPFKYEVDSALSETDGAKGACFTGEVISARARADGERLLIDAEIGMCGTMWETEMIRTLDKVTFGEEITRNRGQYIVCYPSSSDNLWNVAKRYGVPVASVVSGNMMSDTYSLDSETSLEGISYLII